MYYQAILYHFYSLGHYAHCLSSLLVCSVMQDKKLLAKLSTGDLIGQDALYHLPCLISLCNGAETT